VTTTNDDTPGANRPDELSLLVIQLFKGPLYRDSHEKLWEPLTRQRRRVADHVAIVGLRLEVDETDGYAFLRGLHDGESDMEYPRLIARHTLSFTTSLLIALLRKRLLEFDTSSSEARLIVSRDQILELIRVYAPPNQDDVKFGREIDRHIKRIEELGFLHRLRGSTDQYEVRRIIRAFVDGQWLGEFDQRLRNYLDDVAGADGDTRTGANLDTGDDTPTNATPDSGNLPVMTGAEDAT
jgi:hypothetical protein